MWLYDKKKQHGIKENKEKEGSGISGSPLYRSQKTTLQKPILNLKKNKQKQQQKKNFF